MPKSTVVQDVVLPELTIICPSCNGTAEVEIPGFSSTRAIIQTCRVCSGRGFLYQSADELTDQLLSALTQLAELRAATWCPNGCRPLKWDTQFSAFCPACHFSKVSVSAWGQPSPASAVKEE